MSSYGLWLSAAGMKVNDHRQSVLANNMANVHTTGFKQDLAVVTQRAVESRENVYPFDQRHPVLDGLAGGVNVRDSFHDFSPGALQDTGKPLDVALVEDGFFVVSDGTNERYTRNGAFTVNTEGELVMSAGGGRWRVLDTGGAEITISPDLPEPRVSYDGTIRQGEEVVGQLQTVDFEDLQSLRKSGQNVLEATTSAPQPIDARVQAGALERSNFDVMKGLASMIEATRAYEMNANLLRMQDEMTERAVSTIGRLS